MSLYSTEMGDHLGIIIFSLVLLLLLNSVISLRELYKTPIVICTLEFMYIFSLSQIHENLDLFKIYFTLT